MRTAMRRNFHLDTTFRNSEHYRKWMVVVLNFWVSFQVIGWGETVKIVHPLPAAPYPSPSRALLCAQPLTQQHPMLYDRREGEPAITSTKTTHRLAIPSVLGT